VRESPEFFYSNKVGYIVEYRTFGRLVV